MQAKTKKIIAIASVPLLIAGWAAFRPELLFIDSKVNETAPTANAQNKILAKGSFASYAHETTGTAQIWSVDGKPVLRLSGFKTSNGPDVHVYLVKGNDPKMVSDGKYLDLGSIKGNIGGQNYDLPAGTMLSDYNAVTIWCKRFAVGFGGAKLEMKQVFNFAPKLQNLPFAQLASFSPEIMVTGGKFKPEAKGVKGRVDIVERDGKRYVRLTGVSAGTAKGIEVYLVKKETVAAGTDITKLEKVELGGLKAGKSQEFSISKELDVWLWRSVTLWNPSTKKPLGSAALRSAQEKPSSSIQTIYTAI
ncbi:MAG: DM13 domain-containing protein [Armatimonadetes bacterium]|nr:DM13 domain-containing protein [Armatimonadota bacterium]